MSGRQGTQRRGESAAQAGGKGVARVLSSYSHGVFMVFSWYSHGVLPFLSAEDYGGLAEPIPDLPCLIPLWRTKGSFTASYKHTVTGSRAVWEDGSHEAFESLESRCEREPESLAGAPSKR